MQRAKDVTSNNNDDTTMNRIFLYNAIHEIKRGEIAQEIRNIQDA